MRRIGLDCRILSPTWQRTGVGNYALQLVNALPEDPEIEYLLLTDRDLSPEVKPPRNAREIRLRWPLPVGWQQGALPLGLFRHGVDAYHSFTFTLPRLAPARTVVTIHDLTFLIAPELCDPAVVAYLGPRIRRTVSHADLILAISEHTRQDILRLLPVPPERVHVTPLGVSPSFVPQDSSEVDLCRHKWGLTAPYVLCVGTVEPRKNVERIIQAFDMAVGDSGLPHHLVIAGGQGWRSEGIYRAAEEARCRDRIHWLGYVPDAELPLLYSGADLFAFCSVYEGFGLPVLEAMACGTPVLTSRSSSLVEVAGNAARLVDPLSTGEIAQAMVSILSDDAARQRWSALGRLRAAEFSWQETARLTVQSYRTIL